ncbi:MAG: hypothetical protein JSR21_08415 [Proteobacteria bacterium]|nr:hypothetical protein [Pseudomonadota bacterium]
MGLYALLVLTLSGLHGGSAAASGTRLTEVWRAVGWGESAAAIRRHFGARAEVLPQAIDFGDSYAPIVLRDVKVGRVALIAFFQMDKATGGLKRIQLERQRHGVNPPAFRGVVAGLEDLFGPPDAMCVTGAVPSSGYQAATELSWSRGGDTIRAVFRDTTIQAYEGCLGGDLSAGPCGLTGQLIVRISPAGEDRMGCGGEKR